MSARLGVGIGRESVRAVLVRRGTVVWSAGAALGTDDSVRDALVGLLADVPRLGWVRPRVVAAVGPAAAQVKRLSGVPALANRAALTQLVVANAGRFFLKNGIPLRVTDVHVPAPGEVWAGAIEAPIVDALTDACRDLKLPFDGAFPTVAVLAHASSVGTGTIVWRDGDTCAETVFEERTLVRTRRLPGATAGDGATQAVALASALAPLGDAAADFADAYGAAVMPKRGAFVTRPDAGTRARGAAIARLGILVALLAASAAAALTAPGLAASRRAAHTSARIAELEPVKHEIAGTQRTMAQIGSAFDQVADFAARRRSMTRLLGALAVSTPDSTAIVTLRIDSAGGSFVALAPRGAAVLPSLGDAGGITGASISGPVTRELVGAQELERVAIRFRLRPLLLPPRRP